MIRYEIEFIQKPYIKRPIVDALLDQYVKMIAGSSNFKPHQNIYGTQNNGFVRYVHFFSDIDPDRLRTMTKKYVAVKNFDFKMRWYVPKPDNTNMSTGGRIWKFLNEKF